MAILDLNSLCGVVGIDSHWTINHFRPTVIVVLVSRKSTPIAPNSTVREITKSSSTFSATDISSNMILLLQLHVTIQMKSNYTKINCNHDNIAIRSHIMINDSMLNFWYQIYLTKGEKRLFFHWSTCSVRKMVLMCLVQNIDMCLLYKSHQIARLVSQLINYFSKWMFTV